MTDFLSRMNKRERYLALATITVVSLVAVYALLFEPIASRWRSLNNQIMAKVNMLSKDSRILASRQAIEEEYSKLAKRTKASASQDQQIADTLSYIEGISKNDSCMINNIKPIDVKTTDSYKEVLIEVNTEGSMQNLSKFMYDIENPRDNLINVKRFTVTPKSGPAGPLKGSFVVGRTLLD